MELNGKILKTVVTKKGGYVSKVISTENEILTVFHSEPLSLPVRVAVQDGTLLRISYGVEI